MDSTKRAVFYKEDVAEALKCSEHDALNFIKNSGFGIKIGKRYAIPFDAFFAVLYGQEDEYRKSGIVRRSFDVKFSPVY